NPFDSMEKAIVEAYQIQHKAVPDTPLTMTYEYPLEGHPPMMTHVYEFNGNKLVAAKGAAERIIRQCHLSQIDIEKTVAKIKLLSSSGYRVIGVASATFTGPELPLSQDDFDWRFEGLLALQDPPKQNISDVFRHFYKAGIEIKLITGDYPETAMAIAGQTGITNHRKVMLGDQIMTMNIEDLRHVAREYNVFARMFPDAKVKIVEALKANGEVVAMTGDGVNDGPALKSADIGIAMGQKGTEIARQASDIILTDDNLERMVIAISEGRRIYSNLRKAVSYIISIHIPILLTASLPVVFGWLYPNIFTPIHVIFLELIMGPTCSIFFEREPLERNAMKLPPRKKTMKLFTNREIRISISQGLVIAAAVLSLYYYFMQQQFSIEQTRTIVFTTLIASNLFLTFTARSFDRVVYKQGQEKNKLVPVIIAISAFFLLALHTIPFVRELFRLAPISIGQFSLCLVIAFVSVIWFELYKLRKKPTRLATEK
ncbi:MAG TPA: cation-translocating P-type ATPase, partial [Chitinophagaceae bacterium]|nr:cation-translocating P-type ATPase [Chitinophagaceae bacterium]